MDISSDNLEIVIVNLERMTRGKGHEINANEKTYICIFKNRLI